MPLIWSAAGEEQEGDCRCRTVKRNLFLKEFYIFFIIIFDGMC